MTIIYRLAGPPHKILYRRRMNELPQILPLDGVGDEAAWQWFARQIEAQSADLGAPTAFAHMDPPTPDLASRLVGLNARYNQNLLHPDLSPFASRAEARVIDWLAPAFGMQGGHMCSGSTLANLTALWCARESGAKRVISSIDAHISIAKSAHLLGLPYEPMPVTKHGRLDRQHLGVTDDAVVVLNAGTTGRGVIDELALVDCAWTHVDAAWAGPLRFTRYAQRLDGIEACDSVAISAHKWLYQPKDSALILFADTAAQEHVTFGSSYLATANVGVQGSRSAAGVALLATLLAWGQHGLASRIEKNMDDAQALATRLANDARVELKQVPETGVVNWRPIHSSTETMVACLGDSASSVEIDGACWLRHVAANLHVDIDQLWARISRALDA
ncbi:MAG: aspartate aminotransferase family protein [Gammaproteobacteria bacterium]